MKLAQKGHLEQVSFLTKYNESEHQKASTMLDKVKAAKEVESMHIENFVKVFSLIENIQKRQDDKEIAMSQPKGVSNGQ